MTLKNIINKKMLLSDIKDESNMHISSYQDFLCAEGELESYIITLKRFQMLSSEMSNADSEISFKDPISEIKNTFIYNFISNDEEQEIQQIVNDLGSSYKNEKFIENQDNQEKKSYYKNQNKKKDLINSILDIRVISSYKYGYNSRKYC